jgi:hypothetical protein
MTFLGRIQGSDLPGQIVIAGPAVSLWTLIVTPTRRGTCRRSGQADPSYFRRCMGCIGLAIFDRSAC